MSKIENPPAYPIPDIYTADGVGVMQGSPGMSLRDWFAGQAIAIVAETYPEWQLKVWFGDRGGIRREEIRAKAAYVLADAMLAERAKVIA